MNLTPPSNPPSKSPSPGPSNARKRNRSQSMESATTLEATVKRPITSNEGLMNDDIDEYMATQDAGPAMMSAEEKFQVVEKLTKTEMLLGQTWYLVAGDWWRRWRKACTGVADKASPEQVEEREIGPVDNMSLLDETDGLRTGLIEGEDVVYVPQEAWEHLVTWYGEAKAPLPRQTIVRGIRQTVSLEMQPPRVKILRLGRYPNVACTPRVPPQYQTLTFSETDTMKTFFEAMIDAVRSSSMLVNYEARVWKVDPQGDSFDCPVYPLVDFQRDHGTQLFPDPEKTLSDEGIQSEDCIVVEFPTKGKTYASDPEPANASTAVTTVFAPNNGFFNQMGASTTTTRTTSYDANSSYYGPPAPPGVIKSVTAVKKRDPGTLGLGNMGNTCFMNSAIQCLAHIKELTDYFLTGLYREELNPDNPLGMQGAIAEAFGALMQRIWDEDSSVSSYSPREFKMQLQRFAPQFSGYQQHDTQELVAFLLDGLHEDLNRILKKPYVEKPDWEGGGDAELAKLARDSWDGYMQRNDSVVVDLFQGQYQSTLVCPECKKVSITFDPFMYLTLPLPVQKHWKHDIHWIPWDTDKSPLKIPILINANASFKDLRALLGKWMDVNPDNLLTMETWHGKFYRTLNNNVTVGEMNDNDVIVCYELPCNARMNPTYKPADDEPFIVPLFLTDAGNSFTRNTVRNTFWGHPTIACISQEQARTPTAIYEAVMERLRAWTDNTRDLYQWETDSTPTEIHIQPGPMPDSLSEINENGEIVTVQEAVAEEGDIVDEKSLLVSEANGDVRIVDDDESVPRKLGPKAGIFHVRLLPDTEDYGCGLRQGYSPKYVPWAQREEASPENGALLRADDSFHLEFEEPQKQYYFGDSPRFEHARWNAWQMYVHPEFKTLQEGLETKRTKSITLQDCLDEFTRQEQLGEDDLWYCPDCKKHQQATKKFDLWKVPDVLVVHLKRFSNVRTLRDKIDALVDFPLEGLDLSAMVGEREVANRLEKAGTNLEELRLGDVEDSLTYDLFAVDEHMGGLGGGHYRAYAENHVTGKWYHFDDSFVTPVSASDAVNPNAYLLFYRRRSSRPLGGKTHEKVEEARSRPKMEEDAAAEVQLPTPPGDNGRLLSFTDFNTPQWRQDSSRDDDDAEMGLSRGDDDADMGNMFLDPSSSVSPTSSNEVEVDTDSSLEPLDDDSMQQGMQYDEDEDRPIGLDDARGADHDSLDGTVKLGDVEGEGELRLQYPASPALSDTDPFSDPPDARKEGKDEALV
ncbi:cysteine proteinase [Cylindrobasidium torrendii FP15055 ss-10]|uniref:ubiquitinyl hydrolase 1 n=1 Tax=Cylindrobasidium torrendii FP15055 ss-10 TaxID=1314674 RepID=A0A0D7BN48_9AGAR|nr:cysteine proteinase [Cylindrobasidium torrendii FP15055 ss-10]